MVCGRRRPTTHSPLRRPSPRRRRCTPRRRPTCTSSCGCGTRRTPSSSAPAASRAPSATPSTTSPCPGATRLSAHTTLHIRPRGRARRGARARPYSVQSGSCFFLHFAAVRGRAPRETLGVCFRRYLSVPAQKKASRNPRCGSVGKMFALPGKKADPSSRKAFASSCRALPPRPPSRGNPGDVRLAPAGKADGAPGAPGASHPKGTRTHSVALPQIHARYGNGGGVVSQGTGDVVGSQNTLDYTVSGTGGRLKPACPRNSCDLRGCEKRE